MDRDTRNSAFAAFVILALFFAFAYYLPVIMMAAVHVSGFLAAAVVAVFLLVLFLVFWLRGKSQGRKQR